MIADAAQAFDNEIAVADRALAGLPLETLTVSAAGRAWTLQAARDQDRLLAAAEGLGTFPFGLLLWESAIVLADVLADGLAEGAAGDGATAPGVAVLPAGRRLSGLTVLELGAGTGLCGLAAADLGASVVQTDHSAEALALCRRNASANCVTGVTQRFGDWTDWRDETRYDLVIGADILYESSLYGALVHVMNTAVAPGQPVLLTDPTRRYTPRFIAGLKADGWQVLQPMRRVAALPPARLGETVPVNVIVARKPGPCRV